MRSHGLSVNACLAVFSALLAARSALGAWTIVPSPDGDGRRSMLNAVAGISSDDVWAVGLKTPPDSGAPQTLVEHWDGLRWNIVPSPNRPGRGAQNVLHGVTAVAADDVWAVGYSVDLDSPTIYSTLALHWDGSSWSIVPTPNLDPAPRAYNALLSVSAAATDDTWAVGGAPVADAGRAIFMHWDGIAWSLFPAPLEVSFWFNSSRFSVVTIASDDAWSVGAGESIHWDGVSWTALGGAEDDAAIAAADPSAVWAVGSFTYYDEGEYFGPFTKASRWAGDRWIGSLPRSPRADDNFAGVAVVSDTDVWGVGRSGGLTLTEHWDGTSWSVVDSPNGNPNPPSGYRWANWLLGAAALSTDDLWAVGYFYESDAATQHTLILHWDGSPTGSL